MSRYSQRGQHDRFYYYILLHFPANKKKGKYPQRGQHDGFYHYTLLHFPANKEEKEKGMSLPGK